MTSNSYTIFVVDDDDWYRKLLVYTLELNPDFNVKAFEDGASLLEGIKKEKPQVLTLDYRLPDTNGEELLKKVLSVSPNTKVIVISDQSEIETAVNLLKIGAFDYITKTKDIKERLHNVIRHIRERSDLEDRIEELQTEVQEKYDFQNSIIGQSEPLKRVFHLIKKATTTNISVIINGETGTGKEVVAKAIHYNSNRKDNAFVAVNMSAIPKELAESELFGHEKGAFTGAASRHIGKFEQAKGGTLFLDEMGEMDKTLQAKILRALQEKEIVRVGGKENIKIDCRIVAATHRDLLSEVKEGNFREDLYFRLFGLTIELPPLRERGKDILLLAKHFISSFCKENGMPAKKLSSEASKKLMGYGYPGNIRELKSVVELAVVMSEGDTITDNDISFGTKDIVAEFSGEEMTLKEYNQRIVKHYLKTYDDDIKLVAQKLDIGQSTIYRMLKEM
ncbi:MULTISPECIES: sigma-54-dependent transcriptional regulator [Roseivirga]|jgi:DNA-binding NtrC family response regulator|uniref:Regulator n=1 Tax=Roseivirga spongicola TaxID=333140 RepID=A0A150XG88_9BACT|nr:MULTISPECIES: sigma-54 dependent transcriptional regulator [Roseivirga]KYG77720.1 regulator [Roseivirga spongicola]MBO6493927.1 sigma-54-dependent Fis family transcriptional regulator [Roseivirga sp.]MBO6661473.1 sigma-54-dependent Fis family transcriptional regulator [Roseivirga sp.]MBO6759403.1 sigma-54-dependent Fis family transcriptional regulator [Roseivirga sp.]MBO6908543.1 sigma-54-dependent Fis family transcriptional regulator [Roseivirga sp.]